MRNDRGFLQLLGLILEVGNVANESTKLGNIKIVHPNFLLTLTSTKLSNGRSLTEFLIENLDNPVDNALFAMIQALQSAGLDQIITDIKTQFSGLQTEISKSIMYLVDECEFVL